MFSQVIYEVFIKMKLNYRKVASSRPVYYLILENFGQRSQYISIKFPLHKESENHWTCALLTETCSCYVLWKIRCIKTRMARQKKYQPLTQASKNILFKTSKSIKKQLSEVMSHFCCVSPTEFLLHYLWILNNAIVVNLAVSR